MNYSALTSSLILLTLTEAFAVLAGFAIGIHHGWPYGVIVTLVLGIGFYVIIDTIALSYLRMSILESVTAMLFQKRKSQ